MPSLIILRGLPGSGKTTLARLLSGQHWPVFAIDDYFTNEKGEYHFRFADNHLAYKNCQERTEQAMKEGIEKVFLDNAFTLDWEIEPYFKLAEKYEYSVFVITVEKYHHGENVHGIDKEQLTKMAAKYKVKLI